MKVICCKCGVLIREKEPMEDKRISHSYCVQCKGQVDRDIEDLKKRML